MKECLNSAPHARPDFEELAEKLRQTSHLFEKEGQENLSMVNTFVKFLDDFQLKFQT